MAENKVALAVGCHPDDVEFMMAGTLSLLHKAGYECHLHTMANGSCGTAEYDEDEIIRIRRTEARQAAELLGATYHEGLVNDLMVYYDDSLIRRATALVREIKPTIVLLPSLEDYMEDHTNTARVMVTACFCRGMRNYFSEPRLDPFGDDIALYHAQPHMHIDSMRNIIRPSIAVDIETEIALKEDMLRAHASQKNWLDVSQGMDSYLHTMHQLGKSLVELNGLADMTYAEGWRQHSHIGFSTEDKDPLSEALGNKAIRI
jgi:N-acetylglucosamine malate deacetylase 1